MYDFGTIVLIPFPFTDLSSSKLRPALIVSQNNKNDITVAFITIKSTKRKGCFKITDNNPYFAETGLKVTSTIRFDKLATISKKLALGELGKANCQLLNKMKPVFFKNFGF